MRLRTVIILGLLMLAVLGAGSLQLFLLAR